jgi:hypothetical protein
MARSPSRWARVAQPHKHAPRGLNVSCYPATLGSLASRGFPVDVGGCEAGLVPRGRSSAGGRTSVSGATGHRLLPAGSFPIPQQRLSTWPWVPRSLPLRGRQVVWENRGHMSLHSTKRVSQRLGLEGWWDRRGAVSDTRWLDVLAGERQRKERNIKADSRHGACTVG